MKNKITSIAIICFGLLFLSSCVTHYAQRGGWPDVYGYSDSPLDSTTYQVTFAGNSATGVDVVDRYALYRAAELTVDKGFDYFVVIDAQNQDNTNTVSNTTTQDAGHTTQIEHDVDPQTGKTIPVAVTTSTPQYMTTTSTTTEHTVVKTIRMFKGARPADNASAYDAKSMLSMMGPTISR